MLAHLQERMSGNVADGDDTNFTHSKDASTILSIESYAPDATPQGKADTQCHYHFSTNQSPKVTSGCSWFRMS